MNTSDKKYVVLRGIAELNEFYSLNVPGVDQTKLADGTVAYDVIAFVDTTSEAERILFGDKLQDQRSTFDQLVSVLALANRSGHYDAADHLKKELDRWARTTK